MGASDARKRAVLDRELGSGSPTATWYWALSTTEPQPDGTGFTEPVGNSYARVAKTNNPTNFPAAQTASGKTFKRNGTDVTWPNPTGPWGNCGWYGLFEGAAGGTYQYANAMDEVRAPKTGTTPVQLDAGQAEFSVA